MARPFPIAHALAHFLAPETTESNPSHPWVERKTRHEIVFVHANRVIVRVTRGAVHDFEEEIERLYRPDWKKETDEPPFSMYSYGRHVVVSIHEPHLAEGLHLRLSHGGLLAPLKLLRIRELLGEKTESVWSHPGKIKETYEQIIQSHDAAIDHLKKSRAAIEKGIQSKDAQKFARLIDKQPRMKEFLEKTRTMNVGLAGMGIAGFLMGNPIFGSLAGAGSSVYGLTHVAAREIHLRQIKRLMTQGVHGEWVVHQQVPVNAERQNDDFAQMERRGMINETVAALEYERDYYQNLLDEMKKTGQSHK